MRTIAVAPGGRRQVAGANRVGITSHHHLVLLSSTCRRRPPLYHLGQRGGGGSPVAEPLGGGLLQLGHLGPDRGALPFPAHHLAHRVRDNLPPLGRLGHPERSADAVGEQHGVLPLLGVERPRHHGHAVDEALEHGVPAAVGEEGARGGVRQHLGLRRPGRDHQPHAGGAGAVHEALGEVGEGVALALRVVVVVVDGAPVAGAPHHPQEPLAAELQPQRQLPHLLRRQRAAGPERDEHHRPGRLPVQPLQARRRRRAVLPPAVGVDERADRVHRGPPAAGAARLRLAQDLGGARLDGVERVDEDGVRVPVLGAVVHHPAVAGVGLVLQRHEHVGPRDGHAPGQAQRLRHVPERAGHGGVQRVGAEEVGHEGRQAAGRAPPEAGEDGRQRRHRARALLRHARLDGGGAGQVGEVDGREGQRGHRGRERGQERALRGRRRGRERDERGRGAVPRRQPLRQLRQRDQVPHPGRRQHRHVRPAVNFAVAAGGGGGGAVAAAVVHFGAPAFFFSFFLSFFCCTGW
uniref:Uncharacterized protein n=1 Tax=Zea mays TaxID=4577 RepID=A0A804NKK5_MAIZE